MQYRLETMNTKTLKRRSKLFCTAIVSLIVFALISPVLFAQPSGIRWESDLNAAMLRAEREQRPLFVHFVGNASPATQQMEREVFVVPNIAAQLNANFVLVRINASENPALAQRYSITSIPTDLVMKPNGEIIHQRVGVIEPERFVGYLAFLQKTIQADRASPPPSIPTVAPNVAAPPVSAPANHPASLTAGPFPGAIPGSIPAQTHPVQSNPIQSHFVQTQPVPTSPPASSLPIATPSQLREMVAVPASAAPGTAPPVTAQGIIDPFGQTPVAETTVAAPPVAPPVHANHNPLRTGTTTASPGSAHTAHTAPNNTVQGNTVQGNTEGVKEFMANAPAPVKMMVEVPLALEGYCPVTLYTSERWLAGNPAFCTMYQGHIFRFASREALETFAQSPADYTPVAMGEDIVLMVDRNQRVNGSRQLAAYCQGRILLFSSPETFDAFEKRPDYYMEIALRYEMARRDPAVQVVY